MSLKAEKRRLKEELRKEREAVRRKAAIEKATARKIARESMELIEDEQLELMEMAVSRKGLSSIISLDHDTMQNLESFRGRIATHATLRIHNFNAMNEAQIATCFLSSLVTVKIYWAAD